MIKKKAISTDFPTMNLTKGSKKLILKLTPDFLQLKHTIIVEKIKLRFFAPYNFFNYSLVIHSYHTIALNLYETLSLSKEILVKLKAYKLNMYFFANCNMRYIKITFRFEYLYNLLETS